MDFSGNINELGFSRWRKVSMGRLRVTCDARDEPEREDPVLEDVSE